MTDVSIFMALITIRVSPACTEAPGATDSSTTEPPIGLSTASSPASSGSAGGAADGSVLRPAGWMKRLAEPAGFEAAVERSGFSASKVVRASPALTEGSATIALSWPRLVGRPAMWNSASARPQRSRAEAREPVEFDRVITLANIGSNCGGGLKPA